MKFLRANTAVRICVGPFLDETDGVTPQTSLTVTNCKITLTVDDDDNSAVNLVIDAAATASGGDNDMVHVTNDDAGFYDLELTQAQTNYAGHRGMLAITDAANHCPVFHELFFLPAAVYDSLFGGAATADGVVLGSAAYKLAVDSSGKVAVPDAQKVDLNTVKTRAVQDYGSGHTYYLGGDNAANGAAGGIPIVGSAMTLADDAITSAKFDETTAFPITAADSGATYVARAPSGTQTLDTIASAIGGIGSSSGASLNYAVSDDNVDGAIPSTPYDNAAVSFTGTQDAGTYADTKAAGGTAHTISDTGNVIRLVYKFALGAGRNAAAVQMYGRITAGDSLTIKAWNGTTDSWDLRKTVTGASVYAVHDIKLLADHTETGTYAGQVFLLFECATDSVLYVDELLCSGVSIASTTGYADGAVWVKAAGTSGTTPDVNGTADNPCPWADALVVAAAKGLTRFRIINGETVTLTGSAASKSLIGKNWTLALGGQSVANGYFEGCSVSGVSSGTGAEWVDCHFTGTATVGGGDFFRCGFGVVTFTMLASSNYNFVACFDDDPDTSTSPIFVCAASSVVGARNWRGAFQVSSMSSTNKLTLDGAGRLVITDTSVGGTITLRGFFPPITGGAGLHTAAEFVAHGGSITQTQRYGTDQNIGVDWSNVSNPTSTVGLSGTTVGDVTTKTGYTASPTAGSIVTASFGTCVLPETTKTNLLPAVAAGAKSGLPILDASTGLILTGYGAGAVTTSPTAGSIVTASFGTCVPPAPTGMSTLTQTQVSGGAYDLTNATFISALKSGLGTIPASGDWATVGAAMTLANGSIVTATFGTCVTPETANTAKLGFTGTSPYYVQSDVIDWKSVAAPAMTGDAYSYVVTNLGALGAAATALAPASTALSNATWTGTKAGYLDAAISTRQATVINLANAVTMAAQFATMVVLNGAVYDFTAAALAAAPVGTGATTADLDARGITTANKAQTGDSFARIGAAGAGLTAVTLGATGLDSITATRPTGVATTFPQMLVALFYRLFGKATKTATQIKTYAANGTTVVTTQTVSDDGSTETQGEAS